MELKGRLKLIADKVPKCDTVCDIGTDHAYVPIYLVLNKICMKAIATDVKRGPVLIADKNIKKYKIDHMIETRVGNGFECINEGESEVIIIAGMGGMLIRDILQKDTEKAKKLNSLILQPMNAIEVVREWLFENGFDIYDEQLANEDRRIYNVIAARWVGQKKSTDKIYNYIGEKLIENKDPLLSKFLHKKLKQVGLIIKGLEKAHNMPEGLEEYKSLYNEMKYFRDNLDEKKEESI